jgi:hypothetical protein
MDTTRKELIADSESLFHLTISVSIFFLLVIELLYKSVDTPAVQIGAIQLSWANLPVFLLFSYIFFRICREKVGLWLLKGIRFLLIAHLAFIATAASVVTIYKNTIDSIPKFYTLFISLWGSILIPLILSLSLLAFCFIPRKFLGR